MLSIPQSPSRRDQMESFVAEAHEKNQARRERVLRHPDLAKRLTEKPFAISDPERWNGWIPPAELASPRCRCGEGSEFCDKRIAAPTLHNDSPVRAQLVEIAAEAYRRETEDGQS